MCKATSKTINALLISVIVIFSGCAIAQEDTSQKPSSKYEFTYENPYKEYAFSYKAETHVHSDAGVDPENEVPPTIVETKYRDYGYDIIFLTDHNYVTRDPGIGCVEVDSEHQKCILHINSGESGWACWHHIITLGITTRNLLKWDTDNLNTIIALGIPTGIFISWAVLIDPMSIALPGIFPAWLFDWADDCFNFQKRINRFAGDGALVVLAHPTATQKLNNGTGYDLDQLIDAENYHGMEIWVNGSDSTDWWDVVNNSRCQEKIVWGFASDDCEDIYGGDFNRGWIIVNSAKGPISDFIKEQRNSEMQEDILNNIKFGNFYSVVRKPCAGKWQGSDDDGPTMKITVEGPNINVQTDKEDSQIRFMAHGLVKQTSIGSSASYLATGESYIRVEIIQSRNSDCYIAYSQPLRFVDINPKNQGVDVRVFGITLAEEVTFYFENECYSRIVTLHGASDREFQVVLPRGAYTVRAHSVTKFYDGGQVSIPIKGFEFMEITLQTQGKELEK